MVNTMKIGIVGAGVMGRALHAMVPLCSQIVLIDKTPFC